MTGALGDQSQMVAPRSWAATTVSTRDGVRYRIGAKGLVMFVELRHLPELEALGFRQVGRWWKPK